jgi:hypothetical protein
LIHGVVSSASASAAAGSPPQSLTAALFVDGDTFFAPTVTSGAVTLTPSLFADADTFFAPVVTLGSVNDPNFANVELLLGFNGADGATSTSDEGPDGRTITFTSQAQLDTAQFKFGASSLLLDGTDDIITVPDSTDWDFTGQFTVECWFRVPTMSGGTRTLIAKRNAASSNISWDLTATLGATSGIGFELSTDGTSIAHSVSSAGAGVLSANTWYHVAVDRDASNKIRLYLDGVMKASKTSATGTPFNSANALSIGGRANTGQPWPGWIDEVRITRGVARYASDGGFTPPSAAFPRS